MDHLLGFRGADHPKTIIFEGQTWSYLVVGKGDETVLLLPGGTGEGEMYFEFMEGLSGAYRVVAVSYPPEKSINGVLDGILAVMDHEDVAAAHLLGSSYGGMVAQCLARRNPGRIRKIVLANSLIPDFEYAANSSRGVELLPLIPGGLLRRILLRKVKDSYLPSIPEGERIFWETFFRELYGRASIKSWAKALSGCCFDMVDKFSFEEEGLKEFPMLIMESDDDQAIDPGRRERLNHAYPHARVHTFRGAGHMAIASRSGEYIDAVKRFFVDPS